jgi:hypothetical protein
MNPVTTKFDEDDLRTLDAIAGALGLERAEVILRAVRLAGTMRAVYYMHGVMSPIPDPRGAGT